MTERAASVLSAERAAPESEAAAAGSSQSRPPVKRTTKRKAARARGRNGLMLLAISLVSFALGLGLHLQVGLPAWLAAFIALGSYVALISLQILIQRTRAIEQLDADVRALRLEIEHLQALSTGGSPPLRIEPRLELRVEPAPTARLQSPAPRTPMMPSVGERMEQPPPMAVAPPPSAGYQPPALHAPAALPASAPMPVQAMPAQAPAPWAFRPDAREAVHTPPAAPARRAEPQLPPLSHDVRPADPRRAPEPVAAAADPFAFRPAVATPPKRGDDSGPGRPWHKLSAAPPAAPVIAPTTPDEDSVARIQDLIKKLADDVNGGEIAEPRPSSSARLSMRQAATNAASRRAAPAPLEDRFADTARVALDTASVAMREAAKPQPIVEDRRAIAPPVAFEPPAAVAPTLPQSAHIIDAVAAPEVPSAPVQAPLSGRALAVADAIADERIEVMLDPIQSLGDRRARHYELFMRLRDAQGRTMEPQEMLAVARDAGLLGRLEALKLQRTARFATILREKGRQGTVISTVAGDVLGDDHFLDGVANTFGDGDQTTVVLAFDQADVRAFGPIHWETLGVMTTLGVNYMLTEVVDLDMDFQRLTETGFKFAKLDAEVFLEGLPMEDGILPSGDVCSHLADAGLDLIIGGIG